ncbi:hypothetical protein LEL_10910 [Akanthomyces lecanii RCEF 1005]|uniref:Uncharacterized protein n=1 Tax=Akanthomyces lecanii RCEF 1005 TaxID=1081108 RepID=A0A167QPV5_CORDF|nr:hypothetical protein LEL_10910 [Akanthomyces lecanii RCEF 1005]
MAHLVQNSPKMCTAWGDAESDCKQSNRLGGQGERDAKANHADDGDGGEADVLADDDVERQHALVGGRLSEEGDEDKDVVNVGGGNKEQTGLQAVHWTSTNKVTTTTTRVIHFDPPLIDRFALLVLSDLYLHSIQNVRTPPYTHTVPETKSLRQCGSSSHNLENCNVNKKYVGATADMVQDPKNTSPFRNALRKPRTF